MLTGLLLAGCERPDGALPGTDERETTPTMRLEVELTLPAAPGTVGAEQVGPGAAATREEPGRVSGVAEDGEGRIVVVETDPDRIRVHASDGRYLYEVGGPGGGAGQYRSPCCPAVDAGGRVWVRDRGNERYLAFTLDETGAAFEAELPMAHDDAGLPVAPAFDAEGRLVDVGREIDPASGRERFVRFHRTADGAAPHREALPVPPLDSLRAARVESELSTVFIHPPFGPRQVAAHGPAGTWAVALTSRYAVAWRRADGRRLTVVGPDTVGPPVARAERERAAERLHALLERLDVDTAELGLTVAEYQPPLDELLFDSGGRLWVSLLVREGEARRAHVYGADGARQATVLWPAGIALSREGVGREQALGVMQEEGADRVVRLRLVREEPDPGG